MNAFRLSFLVATNALMVVLLVSLLAGCGATPVKYRNGDFISNMASTESVSRDRPLAHPIASPNEGSGSRNPPVVAAASRVAG